MSPPSRSSRDQRGGRGRSQPKDTHRTGWVTLCTRWVSRWAWRWWSVHARRPCIAAPVPPTAAWPHRRRRPTHACSGRARSTPTHLCAAGAFVSPWQLSNEWYANTPVCTGSQLHAVRRDIRCTNRPCAGFDTDRRGAPSVLRARWSTDYTTLFMPIPLRAQQCANTPLRRTEARTGAGGRTWGQSTPSC